MAGVHPFVGRQAELERIGSAVRDAAAGSGAAVLVEGEPGIGKTRLLGEVASFAGDHGVAVLSAHAEPAFSRRPFGAVAAALGITPSTTAPEHAPLADALFGDLPVDLDAASVAGAQLESRLADALVGVVEERCSLRPTVLAIDDAQWADPSSVLVLHRLLRAVRQLPLLLLVACRDRPRTAALDALAADLRDRGGVSLALGGLSTDDVASLTASLAGAAPGEHLGRQLAAAGGNPLYVGQLVEAMLAGNSIVLSDGVAEVGTSVPTPTLQLAALHRMSFLATEVLEVLRAASVLGRSFSVADLSTVLGRPAAEVAGHLRPAIDARVLVDEADRVAFAHDLLRDALYDDIPAALRAGVHRDAALALAGAGAPALQVAEHLVLTGRRDDRLTMEWVRRAAGEASVRSPTIAADLLGRAVDLLDVADAGVDDVLADWAVSLEQAGRADAAEVTCRQLLARRLDPRTEGRARMCLSRVLERTERYDEALAEAEAAMAVEGLTPGQRSRVRANSALLPLAIPRIDLAIGLAEAGIDDPDPVPRAVSAAALAIADLLRVRVEDALGWASRTEVVRDEQPDDRMAQGIHHLQQGACLVRSDAFLLAGRVEEAAAEIDRARGMAERLGFPEMIARTRTRSAVLELTLGRWDEALLDVDVVRDLAEELDLRRATVVRSLAVSGLVAVHRGDLDAARRDLDAAEAGATGNPYDDLHLWLGRARLEEADGNADGALAVLAAGRQSCVRTGVDFGIPAFGPDLVRLAVAAGRRDQAVDAAAHVRAVAERNPGVAWVAVAADRCQGLLEGDVDRLVAAAAGGAGGPSPYDHAASCEQAADAAAGAGRVDDARRLFDEALTTFEALGAAWDWRRATATMRRHGLRRGPQRRSLRPRSGWDALTPSEQRVVELVAEGLSNPQIATRLVVSRRTVQSHVSSALRKLGLTSRLELARDVNRRR